MDLADQEISSLMNEFGQLGVNLDRFDMNLEDNLQLGSDNIVD